MALKPFLQLQIHVGLPQKSLIFKANLITCVAASRSAPAARPIALYRGQEPLCRSLEAGFGGQYAPFQNARKVDENRVIQGKIDSKTGFLRG
jgi:hypothetical protein